MVRTRAARFWTSGVGNANALLMRATNTERVRKRVENIVDLWELRMVVVDMCLKYNCKGARATNEGMKDVQRAREQRPHSEQKDEDKGRRTTDTRSTREKKKGDETRGNVGYLYSASRAEDRSFQGKDMAVAS